MSIAMEEDIKRWTAWPAITLQVECVAGAGQTRLRIPASLRAPRPRIRGATP